MEIPEPSTAARLPPPIISTLAKEVDGLDHVAWARTIPVGHTVFTQKDPNRAKE